MIEPLKKLRLICDGDDHGVGFDLTWEGSFPAYDEARHTWRRNGRINLDAQRFAQVGTWEGSLRVGGEEIAVTPDRWLGTPRPLVGHPRRRRGGAAGTRAATSRSKASGGRTSPCASTTSRSIIILQEEPDGTRVMNDVVRVLPEGSGHRPEQLGWPDIDIHYTSGTRIPTGRDAAAADARTARTSRWRSSHSATSR